MKLVSWNVNGIRAVMKKEFPESLSSMNPDILCLQETKAQDDQVQEALKDISGYHLFTNSAEKKGYSGTAILSKEKPLNVNYGLGIEEHDKEGRVITAEFPSFYLITVYTPNSQNGLKRLDYRQKWDKDFTAHAKELDEKKPVIICGDLNVAHQAIDLKNPKSNYNKSAGYTQAEIDGMDNLLKEGFIDSYRALKPEEIKYSWWSYRFSARTKNIGWRIDYFLTSERLKENFKEVEIHNEVMGSDHCPVSLTLSL